MFLHLLVHRGQGLSLVRKVCLARLGGFADRIRVFLGMTFLFFRVKTFGHEHRRWFALPLRLFLCDKAILRRFAALSGYNICRVLLLRCVVDALLSVYQVTLLARWDPTVGRYLPDQEVRIRHVIVDYVPIRVVRRSRLLLRFLNVRRAGDDRIVRGDSLLEELLLARLRTEGLDGLLSLLLAVLELD